MSKITVLMPAYQCEKTVKQAVQSVLDQTFQDFEFLIIEDGSSDRTLQVLEGFQDPRIKIIRHVQNQGLIASLNEGILVASAPWIARIDADDRMIRYRLEEQFAFVTKHSEFDIVGTNVIAINENGRYLKKLKKKPGIIELSDAWIPTPLFHPSVMMRTELAKKVLFSASAVHCEDYDFWLRALQSGARIYNLPICLTEYRLHSASVTNQHRQIQIETSYQVFQKHFPDVALTSGEFSALIGIPGFKLSLPKRFQYLAQIHEKGRASLYQMIQQVWYFFR